MHYRKIVVWSKAMEAAREIYRLAPLLPRGEVYGMRSQITRARVSVPCNRAKRHNSSPSPRNRPPNRTRN